MGNAARDETTILDLDLPRRRAPRRGARGAPRPGWLSRHGFEVVERYGDDMGYIDLRRFVGTAAARATAIAAMARVAGTRLLILDLRRHRGGSAAMAALLTSLLFDTEPLYPDELYTPAAQLPPVAAEPRCTAQRVEVLVSRETSDVALAFASNLDRLGRASVRLFPLLGLPHSA